MSLICNYGKCKKKTKIVRICSTCNRQYCLDCTYQTMRCHECDLVVFCKNKKCQTVGKHQFVKCLNCKDVFLICNPNQTIVNEHCKICYFTPFTFHFKEKIYYNINSCVNCLINRCNCGLFIKCDRCLDIHMETCDIRKFLALFDIGDDVNNGVSNGTIEPNLKPVQIFLLNDGDNHIKNKILEFLGT